MQLIAVQLIGIKMITGQYQHSMMKIKGKLKKHIPALVSPQTKCLEEISTIFQAYRTEFLANKVKKDDITKYELSAGFTAGTRSGSHPFCRRFGSLMEDVYNVSDMFTKCKDGGCDGRNEDTYFECKSKHNTMKQGQAYNEGYDPEIHRWVSGDKVYELLFPGYAEEARNHILSLLSGLELGQ